MIFGPLGEQFTGPISSGGSLSTHRLLADVDYVSVFCSKICWGWLLLLDSDGAGVWKSEC